MSTAESMPGRVEPALLEELPGLKLRHVTVERGSGRTTRGLKEQLRMLSDRFAGPQAIAMRNKPIPWAYRVFSRHVGLDPDRQRPPGEAAIVDRLVHGGFRSQNLVDDALTIAVIESGVPIRAFDADRLSGDPRIRSSLVTEELEGRSGELPPGTLVVADDRRPLSLLFGPMAAGRGVSPATKRTTLIAIGVSGVPDIAIEEALWIATEALESA